MVAKSLGRSLALMLAFPPAALALGLGDIRLNSTLNAPLDAEIEIIGATPEEVATLRAQIASREMFARQNLEWPAYLGTVSLERATRNGREVLRLRSTEPITEPFVTLLVEVSWARGRLVREYTMLLDPPVYTPGAPSSAEQPVLAAETGESQRSGAIERPAPEPPVAQAAPEPAYPASAPAGAEAGETYEVRRGDTLSGIAARYAGGDTSAARRWMVAAFQANPQAFDGNMNLLRAGAILRIPDAAAVAAITPAEASAEVRRQAAAWRSSAMVAAGETESGRLRLVTPSDGAVAGGGSSASAAEVEALQSRVRELESQLQESRRLLELRNAELAQLRERLGAPDAAVQETPATTAAAEPAVETAMETPADATPAAPEATASTDTPAAEPAPEELAAAEPVTRTEPVEPAATEPAEGETGGLLDTLKDFWWAIALVVAALLGFFGLRAWRSRRESEFDDSLGRLAAAGAESLAAREPVPEMAPYRAPATAPVTPPREDSFLVEETGSHERPRFGEAGGAPVARHVPADETISSETAINLDQGDPLAEADFHMAYGLYDQAADLIRIAINREPERRDLKLKLLEVFFVWGNKEEFLQAARELATTRDQAAPGEWEKIVIMGKQLAPEDPLFAGGAGVSGAAAGGVDLDLQSGGDRVDFDLLGEPVQAPATSDSVDLDIGSVLGDRDPTGSAPGIATDRNPALGDTTDFVSPDATGMTRQLTATMPQQPALSEEFGPETMEAPTVEQPALNVGENPTIRQKVDAALKHGAGVDQTAELDIDDLGLDLGNFETAEQPRLPVGGDASADAPTMVAGLDEHSRRLMEEAERRASIESELPELTPTGSWQLEDEKLIETGRQTMIAPPPDASTSETQATMRIVPFEEGGLDFDVGQAAGSNGSGVDLDIGTATLPDASFAATQQLSPEEMGLPELEPVTMSEVGTKLDLARAYMDMGDPEGARNILEEVLQEGSVAQKQEAQRLLEALPG